MGGEVKCRMVDVRCRLAYDLKEFSHKPEAVPGGVKQSVNIGGYLNLALG